MKLFSRKAVIAGATSIAIMTGALTVPATATEATPAAVEVQADAPAAGKEKGSSDPKEIREWIGVITAILAALGSVVTIASRLGSLKF
ncbi:hypothetical protein [Corynebacterium caspium]|uniref:hypothetical protein n=1 Tax=Corynebacterium caspium TaxID=234828 RepID=UPI00037DBF08|nr:hypothetical protein [Corynebacterium caspium]WKD59183.1 hypothetical protein CCASP_03930 [Corynebacterium caspium DSM 44850]